MKFSNLDINSIRIQNQNVSKVYVGDTTSYFAEPKLLDNYSNAAVAAYSMYPLNSEYTGPIVRVRRSSDNQESIFYSSEITNGTLLSWVNNSEGFISQWYDQSGNGRHAVQSIVNEQPQIVSGNSIISTEGFISPFYNGKRFAIPNMIFPSLTVCFFVKHPILSNNPSQNYINMLNQWSISHASSTTPGALGVNYSLHLSNVRSPTFANTIDNAWSFFVIAWVGYTILIYKNGVLINSASHAPYRLRTTNLFGTSYIGNTDNLFDGYITNILIFSQSLSSTAIANMYNNYIVSQANGV